MLEVLAFSYACWQTRISLQNFECDTTKMVIASGKSADSCCKNFASIFAATLSCNEHRHMHYPRSAFSLQYAFSFPVL